MQRKKFWEIKNLSKTKGELTLFGQIASSSWWDDYITPKQFVQDLKNLGAIDELDVRINSNGGDVFAGQTIYSLLKSHTATVTVYIDGLAASIASIIAMAGDKIVMHPGAMMMIHNPSSGAWGEASDLRKTADILDKVKESLIATYKAKTGKENEELENLMDDETWLTAEEALEKGFIDEISGDTVEACVNNNQVFFNGIGFDISGFQNAPIIKNEAKVKNDFVMNVSPQVIDNKKNKKEEAESMTMEDLQKNHPEIYTAVYNKGVSDERGRIKEIEDLAMPGNEEITNKAKFETGISAEKLAMEIIKAEKNKGKNYLAHREKDVEDSGVKDIKALEEQAFKEKKTEKKEDEIANDIANAMNKRRRV